MKKLIKKGSDEEKNIELEFYLSGYKGWQRTYDDVELFDKVYYLGSDSMDGDMFLCYQSKEKLISIYKGIFKDEK